MTPPYGGFLFGHVVSYFIAFPPKLVDLLDAKIFQSMIEKAKLRYLERLSVSFSLNFNRVLTAHQQWSIGYPEPIADLQELFGPTESLLYMQMHLSSSMRHLCALMSTSKIVSRTTLEMNATERQAERFATIDRFPTEYFSLRICYEGYRHFSRRSTPDRWLSSKIDGVNELSNVIAICRSIHEKPNSTEDMLRGVFTPQWSS